MSADNMIYIQKRGKLWSVWMGFASDDGEPVPGGNDCTFESQEEARSFAFNWYRNETIVEYGVVELDDSPPCANCGENDWVKCMHGVFCRYCQSVKNLTK